jgi:RNA polymerase sigma-70 factor (ECF subfamily)
MALRVISRGNADMPDTRVQTPEAAPGTPVPVQGIPANTSLEGESDVALMHHASSGEMTPYAILFRRHTDRIWRMAYMILHSTSMAEDVVQETFTQGLSHIRSYRGEAEPRTWFSSIALNLCRHILRDRKKEAQLATEETLDQGAHPHQPRPRGVMTSAIRREGNRMLTVALGYLTEAQREVFVLHYIDELPYEDVARILNIRAGAARALAHRAKLMLQKRLGVSIESALKE